jgi:hypothetical protein
MRRLLLPIALLAALALSAGVVAGGAGQDGYTVDIRVAAKPAQSAESVVAVAEAALDRMASSVGQEPTTNVTEVVAVAASQVGSIQPDTTVRDSDDPHGLRTVWVVRAEGLFVTFRGRQPGPLMGPSGYFIISDERAEIIGMGFAFDK